MQGQETPTPSRARRCALWHAFLGKPGFAAQQIGLAAAVAVVFFIGVAAIGLAQRAALSRAFQ